MEAKGRIFTGIRAGRGYDLFAPLFGMGEGFFTQAAEGAELEPGMKVLDLGCGTGKLTFALAKNAPAGVEFHGCDYSPDQVARAEVSKKNYAASIDFRHGSMDELDFEDGCFDLVVCCMALHAVHPAIRPAAVRNACRMLKAEGRFLLVDIATPQPGILAALFSIFGAAHGKAAYDPAGVDALFSECGFAQVSERYLNSLVKKQVFVRLA